MLGNNFLLTSWSLFHLIMKIVQLLNYWQFIFHLYNIKIFLVFISEMYKSLQTIWTSWSLQSIQFISPKQYENISCFFGMQDILISKYCCARQHRQLFSICSTKWLCILLFSTSLLRHSLQCWTGLGNLLIIFSIRCEKVMSYQIRHETHSEKQRKKFIGVWGLTLMEWKMMNLSKQKIR